MPRDPSKGGPTDRERFLHMRDAGRDVLTIMRGVSREAFESDMIRQRAVVNALQIVGEAAARTSDAGRSRCPALPWGKIVATRNILVHVYWGIDLEQIWLMATVNVPDMLPHVEAALESWPPDQQGV
ncbi:MAG: DUF86 domain-containing protein [Phycisphaeraceae bacterium]|nr:DUF86 domain-containing protein [Phycisphaeraceae bacterium]MBX3368192.1 DUF86 domain-containing protein [Phycisphaeraceae bacterium]